ncbi:MAG: DnaJ C-terminal domain-containing protein, partial [bacterium]|nr:DnaJ C-terminal domain-containing protein [bacterium]
NRHGADLLASMHISFPKATLGGKAKIELPGGESVEVIIQAGSQSGVTQRVKGKGMHKPGSVYRGDLVITLVVDTPKKLSTKEKELIRELALAMGEVVDEDKSFINKMKDVLR